MQKLISVLALVTLMEMMAFVGLSVSIPDLARTMKDGQLVLRAVLVNYFFIPVATLILLAAFQASPMVAVGFLLVAVCPGGAFGPLFTAIARGNTGVAAGLMFLLAGLSPLLTPIALKLFLPFVPGYEGIIISTGEISGILFIGQILPLLAGLLIQQIRPKLAAKLLLPAAHTTKILNVMLLSCILYANFEALSQIRARGFVGMFFLLATSLTVGWFCGGGERGGRKAMSFTTTVRNGAVGMVIATSEFAGTAAVTAVAVYGLVVFFGGMFVAIVLGKWVRSGEAPPAIITTVAS